MMQLIDAETEMYADPDFGDWVEDCAALVIINHVTNGMPDEGPEYFRPAARLTRREYIRWMQSALRHAREWAAQQSYPQASFVWSREGTNRTIPLATRVTYLSP